MAAFCNDGYAGGILYVNLSNGHIEQRPTPQIWKRELLGGNGFAVRLAYDLIPSGSDPLSADNILIFAVGPATGTLVPCSSRFVVATKSPLTGFFIDSYVGGGWGEELKCAGYDALVIRGEAQTPMRLVIDNERVRLDDASDLWGRQSFETQRAIRAACGSADFQVATIGPAGENLVRYAAIIAGTRAAGRGGTGAVMGAKKLKAIAVRGHHAVQVADPSGLWDFFKESMGRFAKHPGTGGVLPAVGTGAGINAFNKLGMLPSFNWQAETFAAADAISGDRLLREGFYQRSKACHGCFIRCSKVARTRGQELHYTTEGPEYETLYSLGSLLGNDNIDSIIAGDRICDELGMDTISAGGVIAFAMECFEKGLLTSSDTGGVNIRFGDYQGMLSLLPRIAYRQGIGDLLAEGVRRVAQHVGGASSDFAMHVKGLELVGHSARGLKGMALGYAVSNRGGTHQDTRPTIERGGLYDPATTRDKGSMNMRSQNATTLGDSIPLCRYTEGVFGLFIGPEHARIIKLVTGLDLSIEELEEIAERIYTLERIFNVREGCRRTDDTLPKRLLTEPIPDGPLKGRGVTHEEIEEMLDQYYGIRNWNRHTGIPTPEKLARLKLTA